MLLLFGLAKMKFILSFSKLNETKIFRNLCPETKLGHANVCGDFIALQLVSLLRPCHTNRGVSSVQVMWARLLLTKSLH